MDILSFIISIRQLILRHNISDVKQSKKSISNEY